MPDRQRAPTTNAPTTTSTSTSSATTTTANSTSSSNSAANDQLKAKSAEGTGSLLAEEVDPVSRATTVRTGMAGALIGDGSDISLLSAAEGGSAVATVKDGAPCKVLEVGTTHVKVSTRIGTAKKEGWVSIAVFSNQPALNPDKNDKSMMDDYEYNLAPGTHLPGETPKGSDTAQGALADCFLVASLASITDAVPEFAKTMIRWDDQKKRYIVKFYESIGRQKFKPVEIEVDGYLPTSSFNPADPAYAGAAGAPLWGALIEKAYAKWKGGYDKLGNGGSASTAMEEMTGVATVPSSVSALKEDEVIPFFRKAKEAGQAVCCTSIMNQQGDKQAPLKGSGSGPYTGTLTQSHSWNHVDPGTLWIEDKAGKVEGAWDTGKYGDNTSKIEGPDTKSGQITYAGNKVELAFNDGKAPDHAEDLEATFKFRGVLNAAKLIVGWHVYTFVDIVEGDKIQLYNPWGSWQPKPITAAEFKACFTALSTNAVPKEPGKS